MSSLRERIEGLRPLIVKATTTHVMHLNDPDHPNYQKADYCRLCWELSKAKDELLAALAAALAAEGPSSGSDPIRIGQTAEDYEGLDGGVAAAPSLHKEEPDFGTEVIAGLDAINKHNAALHKEGAGGARDSEGSEMYWAEYSKPQPKGLVAYKCPNCDCLINVAFHREADVRERVRKEALEELEGKLRGWPVVLKTADDVYNAMRELERAASPAGSGSV